MSTQAKYSVEQEKIISAAEEFVRNKLEGEPSGHDWWHIHRVRQNAVRLAREENANLFIVELAALMHDIADWKFTEGDTAECRRLTEEILAQLGCSTAIKSQVCEVIDGVSFKGAGVASTARSLEAMIVQDADRLDALGAVGIARTFAYGGHKSRTMHDPSEKPVLHSTFEQYKSSHGTSINHFYEKLLLLKEKLNTESARRIADGRHAFMEAFLARFLDEWEGKA